ncbi:LysR substrate-binding domain-containing protein [Flavihumibacter solisilvae]|jgi:DNA-binding transcriptional LysR family regulator|uniref:LysR family transcriptional regulator n=1 Tax=Flavihumibacter solisilvae TaxID=1349421 RepID=A0A0C1LGD8_9BACT|nr:LysR substrate-binding domain-containing protein [Flavihumibacter solisilvae]KIC94408.1 LysR family transcriptional regulator [Flavihumibacter solisilvae]
MLSTRHEIFIEVASNLSFSKAADVLFISQPAISKHMKALESFYKTTLFERKGNAIQLTDAGHLLFNRLKEARKIQNQLEYELSVLNDQLKAKGQLKLGASTTVALYIIPKILSSFHQKYPEVKISLLNRNTDTITKALIDEDIDIGIVESKRKNSAILYQPFIKDEVVPVCSAKSPIAKKKVLSIHEIRDYPVVLREQGSGTLAALKYNLEKNGIKLSSLNVTVRLAGTEALKNFLREDTSLGFLPKGAILKELRDGDLVALKIENFQIIRDFYFIQRHGTENNDLNKAFIRYCKKAI